MANSLNKITTKSILDATVATADIADDAVTAAKIGVLDGHLQFGDGIKAKFGAGDDIEIYHESNTSNIKNTTGNLVISDTDGDIHIQAKNGEHSIVAHADGSVKLYHNNIAKSETTTAGINLDNSEGTSGKGKLTFGNSGHQYIEGLDTGNGGSGSYLSFGDGSTERFRVDSSGRFLKGTTAYKSNLNSSADAGGQVAQFIGATDDVNHCLGLFAYSGSTNPGSRGAKLQLNRARSSDGSTNTVLSTNDLIGSIEWKGNDGTNFTAAARIDAYVDAGTGTDDMPGRLVFSTSADGSGVPTERFRVDSSGSFRIAHSSFTAHTGADDLIVGKDANGVNCGMTILNHTGSDGRICFADSGDTDGGMIKYVHNGNYMQLIADGGERARVTAGGITFNGDSAAANGLDDYEEGSWVVAPTTENGSITLSGSINECAYVKIGKLVQITGRVRVDSVSSQSGWLQLSLPFTNISSGGATPDQAYNGQIPCTTHDMNLDASVISTFLELASGSTGGYLMCQRDNGSWFPFNTSDLKNNDNEYIAFSGTYQTDA